MFFIGVIIVISSILGGYTALGGHLNVLWQPFEFVIIGGAAIGAFTIANPVVRIKKTLSKLKFLSSPQYITKDNYLELLSTLYHLFKIGKTKGNVALEQHIESPESSPVFSSYPYVMKNHLIVKFICDYLRLLTIGSTSQYQIEALLDQELDSTRAELLEPSESISVMADGLPALGIVAAVLGMIKTMGALAESPEFLGKLIGAAFVGTFLGVLLSYGFVSPISSFLKSKAEEEYKYLECAKSAILSHIQGNAPSISVEFARKSVPEEIRPTFSELEQAVSNVSV